MSPRAKTTPAPARFAVRALVLAIVAASFVAQPAAAKSEPAPKARAARTAIAVNVDWDGPSLVSRTTPSLQVVVNPLFRPGSPIHDRLFRALAELGAEQVRFVAWLPYPRLAVAALEPPNEKRTFWDFDHIDPMVVDFLHAMGGRSVTMNFSVIPQWMFATDEPVPYPDDPDEITWSYQRGTELRDPSGKELAGYFARVLSWYTNGGFVDERGKRHESPHRFRFAAWEVFNEPNTEHSMTPQQYTERYDAVVEAVRAVAPEIELAGPALSFPLQNLAFFEYFLDPAHHRPGIPIDVLTYHFYAYVPAKQRAGGVCPAGAFRQNDKFAAGAREIEAIRQRLRPAAKTAINEIGAIALEEMKQQEPGYEPKPLEDRWWNLSAAVFAHQFATLSLLGVEVVGQSALAQYPGQYPSVSMIDWDTGRPNARYWVLKMLIDHFRPGDRLVRTTSTSRNVHAQGFVGERGERVVLVVNKCDRPFPVTFPEAEGAEVVQVDAGAAFEPPARMSLGARQPLRLGPFGVAVITLPGRAEGKRSQASRRLPADHDVVAPDVLVEPLGFLDLEAAGRQQLPDVRHRHVVHD